MHLTGNAIHLFAALYTITGYISTAAAQPGHGLQRINGFRSHHEPGGYFAKRDAKTDGCQTLAITVVGISRRKSQAAVTLVPSICLCIQKGVLTADSKLDLEGAIMNSERLRSAEEYYQSAEAVLDAAVNVAQSQLARFALSCPYPPGYVPSCPNHATSTFTTESGRECYATDCIPGTKGCPNKKLASTENHVDDKATRRNLKAKQASQKLCPIGLAACEMSGISLQDGRSPKSLACIDTMNDIEACGGCPFAGSDSPQGDDCTDMQGVDEVICSQGKCKALSCMRGFKLLDNECTSGSAYIPFWSRQDYA